MPAALGLACRTHNRSARQCLSAPSKALLSSGQTGAELGKRGTGRPAHHSPSRPSRRCSPSPHHTQGFPCSHRARCGSGRCVWCK